MDSHPVPKNVLSVEFKLFGALSVRQFMKILIGSIVALVLFVSPIPKLITLPLTIASVLVGIAAAVVPGFEVKLAALVRSVFVSPRYMWRKQAKVPDVLKSKANTVKPVVPDGEDVGIEQILAARSQSTNQPPAQEEKNPQSTDNFERVYQEMFAANQAAATSAGPQIPLSRQQGTAKVVQQQNLAGASTTGQRVPIGPTATAMVQPLQNTEPRQKLTPQTPTPLQATDVPSQLASLQAQLTDLNRQNASFELRQEVTNKINALYAANRISRPSVIPQTASEVRTLFGVVVDKKDKPIMEASIAVINAQGQPVGNPVITKSDGRFAIEAPLPEGEYVVEVKHPKYKFYEYKIKIDKNKLPAYKFRERS